MKPIPYDAIYLSPHLDDVVLSCGGRIHQQSRAGRRILVITVFAGIPERYGITAFTRELEARWGGTDDAIAVRRREDMAALDVLAATGQHLDWPDCVYRGAPVGDGWAPSSDTAYYPTEESIFGEIHPEEENWHQQLVAALVPHLTTSPSAEWYAPLAVGHHVDHLLVRRAAIALQTRGIDMAYYEDYPYAGDQGAIARAQSPWETTCWRQKVHPLDESAVRAKVQAIACHRSQISTFWPNLEAMAQAVREQALCVGRGHGDHGHLAEAYWRLAKDCIPSELESKERT